jgi:hypothetical protein
LAKGNRRHDSRAIRFNLPHADQWIHAEWFIRRLRARNALEKWVEHGVASDTTNATKFTDDTAATRSVKLTRLFAPARKSRDTRARAIRMSRPVLKGETGDDAETGRQKNRAA